MKNKKQIKELKNILTDSKILYFVDENNCLIIGDKDDVIYALISRLREMQDEVTSSSIFGFQYAESDFYDYYVRYLLSEEDKVTIEKEIIDLLHKIVNKQFYCKRDEIVLNNNYSITQAKHILTLIKENQNTLFNTNFDIDDKIDTELKELLPKFHCYEKDDDDWSTATIYTDEEELAKYIYNEIEKVINIKYISLLDRKDIIIEEDAIRTKKYEISCCVNIPSSVIDFILNIIALKEENKEKDEDEYIHALIKEYILKNINEKGYFWQKDFLLAYGKELQKHSPRGEEKIYDNKLYVWDYYSYSPDTYSIIEDLDDFIKEYFLI